MKIQVRGSVFETNSSSMHSIAIVKPENLKAPAADYYGWQLTSEWLKPEAPVEICRNDDSLTFDRWPFQILSTMFEKAQYAVASYGTDEKFDEISKICKEKTGHTLKRPCKQDRIYYITTGLTEEQIENEEIPKDHILDYCDVTWDPVKQDLYRVNKKGNRIYDIDFLWNTVVDYGSIDHQSIGTLQAFLGKHKITLEEFLTNPQYVVIIDGDEYCAWSKMFEAGICLCENFIEPGL